tara:strand:- start:413 stop:655 length:243 start_codon:yes stop_codon:yes gene_type:complete
LDIPDKIIQEIDALIKNDLSCEDWMELKRYLLKCVNTELRTKFSTRDPKTKRQSLNDFEKKIIDLYELSAGVKLRVYYDK